MLVIIKRAERALPVSYRYAVIRCRTAAACTRGAAATGGDPGPGRDAGGAPHRQQVGYLHAMGYGLLPDGPDDDL
eukprot:scaffold1124_cov361-Prasinococcus_capsulatus_cf.AAC.18